MDNYNEFYKQICRICLSCKSGDYMVSLTNAKAEDGLNYYGKAIESFANVSIKLYEELPHNICQKCLLMLKQVIKFKQQCESSDKHFIKLYKHHKESNSNFKELVVDFALFRDTFSNAMSEVNIKEDILYAQDEIIKENISDDEVLVSSPANDQDLKLITSPKKDAIDNFLDKLEKAVHDPEFLASANVMAEKHNQKMGANKPQNRYRQRQNIATKKKLDKYVCEVCQKELANPITYKNHMQRHTGFDYICEHCAKGFPTSVELQMHQITVHGTGPGLQCPHCPFLAPKKYVLVEHIRLHTGERPFSCEKCGLTFRRKALWVKHKIYHKEKTVQCPNCPSKFHDVEGLKSHFNNIHERLYVYMCQECDSTYAKSTTLRKHLTEKHGIPRDVQGKVLRVRRDKDIECAD